MTPLFRIRVDSGIRPIFVLALVLLFVLVPYLLCVCLPGRPFFCPPRETSRHLHKRISLSDSPRASSFAMLLLASHLVLAFVAMPNPNRFGRPRAARCAQVALFEIFQPSGCETSDDTKPLLLFLPGIDGSGLAGASQWPRLRADFSIHALRIPPDDRTSFDAQVDFVERWLVERSAGDRRDALLVGESAGAVLALGVAFRAPSRVSALCLVNPATSFASSPMALVAPLLPLLPAALY